MRHYSLLRSIELSFFSKALYRDVGRNWQGLGFLYMLAALSLFSLPMVLWLVLQSFSVNLASLPDVGHVIDQIPEIHIVKGELSVSVKEPYYIHTQNKDEGLIVIDTTRPLSDWMDDIKQYDNALVVGKKGFLFYQGKKGETRLRDFPNADNIHFTRDDVRGWVENVLDYCWAFVLLAAPFVVLSIFIFRILQVLVYAVFGLLIAKFSKVQLTYIECVRLTAVAITPLLALGMLEYLVHFSTPGLLAFAIAMGYVWFGIRANVQ